MPRILEQRNGQKLVTIPRKLALALSFRKGEKVEFVLNNKGNLEIIRAKEGL